MEKMIIYSVWVKQRTSAVKKERYQAVCFSIDFIEHVIGRKEYGRMDNNGNLHSLVAFSWHRDNENI